MWDRPPACRHPHLSTHSSVDRPEAYPTLKLMMLSRLPLVAVAFCFAATGTAQSSAQTLPPPLPRINELPPAWASDAGLSLPVPLTDPGDSLDLPDSLGQSTRPIGDSIDEFVVEPPPLAPVTTAWYARPWVWLTEGWKNNAELGLDGSAGNAETLATQVGLEMKRLTDRYTVELDIDFRQASARGISTENNAHFNSDFDRLLGETKWSAFTKTGLEYDEFKAFDLRLNVNSGLAYNFIRNSDTQLISRVGGGVSREFDSPDERWKPEALFGGELSHQLNARQKIKAKLNYFPVFDDWSDYRIVSDASWETLVGQSENFSLRLAVTDRYDSTPAGRKPNDFYYSALLLYKF